jgi:COMPASS component SWD3
VLGPLICGDGIDTDGKEILTASWTQEQQLQTWDLGTGKLFMTIDWNANIKTSNDPVFLYAGQFSKIDQTLILAGGSNSNEAKLFDRNNMDKVTTVLRPSARFTI